MCNAMYSGVLLYVISEPQCEMYCCVRPASLYNDEWPVPVVGERGNKIRWLFSNDFSIFGRGRGRYVNVCPERHFTSSFLRGLLHGL